jgi:hypothetical protein
MYIAESPYDPQVLWTGSDDGQIHLTRNGGIHWVKVTPPGLTEGMINSIEVSPHDQNTVYISFNRYKFNDFTPHVYISRDFGNTWSDRNLGFDKNAHVRVVREDPQRKDLLYAGTETGLYISYNGGIRWDKFQLNLPVTPITDMMVHQGDLLVATQGRAFWVLDDLTPLRTYAPADEAQITVYKPMPIYQFGGSRNDKSLLTGTNPDYGLVSYYKLGEGTDSLHLKAHIIDDQGRVVKKFTSKGKKKELNLKTGPGVKKLVWNLRRENRPGVKGLFTFGGVGGAEVPPGNYTVKYVTENDTIFQDFIVHPDPRLDLEMEDFDEKRKWLSVLDTVSRTLYHTVNKLDNIKSQLSTFIERDGLDSSIVNKGKSIIDDIKKLDEDLVQRQQKTFQDVINYENKLDANIKAIESSIANTVPPLTQGQRDRANDMIDVWSDLKKQIDRLLEKDVLEFNELVKESNIPLIDTKVNLKKA